MSELKLPSTIGSAQDLAGVINEIKAYATWFAHESIKAKVAGKKMPTGPALSPAAADLIGSIDALGPAIDALARQLEAYKQTAPSITITLAAPVSRDASTKIIGWARDNLGGSVLVNFRMSAAILGGMIVQTSSRVYDWSFRSKLLARPVGFAEVLKRV